MRSTRFNNFKLNDNASRSDYKIKQESDKKKSFFMPKTESRTIKLFTIGDKKENQ